MEMNAMTFEFNGIKSNELGFYILNYDGFSNTGVGYTGSEVTFQSFQSANSKRKRFTGNKYETPLQFSFQIGKMCVCNDDYEITPQECAFLLRWLVRSDGYRYMRIFQEGYENTFLYCKNKLQWIRMPDGKILGAQLDVECDAPFGYSKQQSFEIECSDGDSFEIYDDGDEIGAIIFDECNILMTSDARELIISNSMDEIYSPIIQYKTKIQFCENGENISIANGQIASSIRNDIARYFNYKPPRLINTSEMLENRINTYTVTGGSCHLSFSYRTIRKAIP